MNINGSSLHFRIRNIVRLSILHPNLVKLTGWFSAKQSSSLARGWRSGGSGPWGTLSWASTLQPYHWGGREVGTHLLPFCNSPSSQSRSGWRWTHPKPAFPEESSISKWEAGDFFCFASPSNRSFQSRTDCLNLGSCRLVKVKASGGTGQSRDTLYSRLSWFLLR